MAGAAVMGQFLEIGRFGSADAATVAAIHHRDIDNANIKLRSFIMPVQHDLRHAGAPCRRHLTGHRTLIFRVLAETA
jgi:hypothetical protein